MASLSLGSRGPSRRDRDSCACSVMETGVLPGSHIRVPRHIPLSPTPRAGEVSWRPVKLRM